MKHSFGEPLVREALGRILRDAPSPGDGKMVLEALENVRETVSVRLLDACALQAEWGRRKLAHDLIEIGREEFERVTTETSLPNSGPGSGSAFGSSPGSSISDPASRRAIAIGKLASRRRGPRYTPDA
jgi:hypothetical protein